MKIMLTTLLAVAALVILAVVAGYAWLAPEELVIYSPAPRQ